MAIHIHQLRIDSDPSVFGDFKSLIEIWQNAAKSAPVPVWRDFDFRDFVGWHGNLAVADVIEPFDLRYRIWGSDITNLLGKDMTGHLFSEAYNTADWGIVVETISNVLSRPCFNYLWGPLPRTSRQFVSFQAVDLPMSSSGERVDMIMHAMLPIRYGEKEPDTVLFRDQLIEKYLMNPVPS